MNKRIVPAVAIIGVVGAYLLGLAAGTKSPLSAGVAPATVPAALPIAASAVVPVGQSMVTYAAPISGVGCDSMEGEALHIHAQLQVYFHGASIPVPAGLGIAGNCTYWLHTHTGDGVIHVEAPVVRTFTLGQFIDVAGMPRFGSGTKVKAFVDTQDGRGFREYTGNHRDIPLTPHAVIALGVGDFEPQSFTFESDL